MATKGDLVQAQSFSRRRLLTAFVSGAPGGKELEPAKPLRAVIGAIVLAVVVVAVGVVWGLIKPGLPQGWENGHLVIAEDTGARFVSVEGTLHPVVNTASARLLLPAGKFEVISTDSASLADTPVGAPLGIVGAPDALPAPGALVGAGWSSCVADDGGLSTHISASPAAKATDEASVVTVGTTMFVVAGGTRYPVSTHDTDAVLRAAGITSPAPRSVPASWINLFSKGTALAPLSPGAARPVAGTDLVTGQVVHITGTADDQRFLLTDSGAMATLSPLAWRLYQLGDGPSVHAVTEVSAAAVRGLQTADDPAGGADWPRDGFAPLPPEKHPCALLEDADGGARTVLAATTEGVDDAGVHVAAGSGALVRAGDGAGSSRMLTLIDATGTAFPLPGATDETIARLGYAADDVTDVPASWTALLPTGPALTTDAAGKTPTG